MNFTSAAGSTNNGDILIPGGIARTTKAGANEQAEGVVITPDPTGIVLKTRLLKEKHHQFSFDDDNVDDSYVPPSLSSIYARSNTGDTESAEINGGKNSKDETKVFINIVTHPLIAVPGQRKGLDEQGKEIDGWRLPMSMGDLRPCYDKKGNAAIVADCMLNPRVVLEMKADSNHFQFICDMVVQCASRKFGRTWFGGLALDRRFKLPNMKYAGYVVETTGLPILPEHTGSSDQKAVVAKQRVKGHGGKSSMIEEIESGPSEPVTRSDEKLLKSGSVQLSRVEPKTNSIEQVFHIELFISDGAQECMPLFNFLRSAAKTQSSRTLRDFVEAPKLKPCNNSETLHESPMPFDPSVIIRSLEKDETAKLDRWSIFAKCSLEPNAPLPNMTTPTVDLSAFLLVLKTSDAKTECILPFPVDVHRTRTTYNPNTGVVEVRMPLLQTALNVEEGPDPGTRPWELRNALGVSNPSELPGCTRKDGASSNSKTAVSSSKDLLGSYLVDAEIDDGGFDDTKPLPEDVFHSQDILSRHLLEKQEEERKARSSKNNRDGADVEHINVDDFRPKPCDGAEEVENEPSTLQVAESVLKNKLGVSGGGLVLNLV